MIFRSIPFLIHEAFLNLRRHGLVTLASITTVAIAFCILGAFSLLALQLRAVTGSLPRRIEVHAFLDHQLKPEEVQKIRQQVSDLSGVAAVRLVSREQAWSDYKARYTGLKSDLEGLEPNPLPDKLEIRATSPERTLSLAARVRGISGVERVQDGAEVLPQLLAINSWVRNGSLVLAGLLAVGTVAIISNLIRLTLFARRREIRVMQLVGATNGFIRLPFLLEGMLDGLAGAGIACGLLYLAYDYISTNVLVNIPLVNEARLSIDAPVYLGVVAAAGLVVGLFGSMVSIRRFLRI